MNDVKTMNIEPVPISSWPKLFPMSSSSLSSPEAFPGKADAKSLTRAALACSRLGVRLSERGKHGRDPGLEELEESARLFRRSFLGARGPSPRGEGEGASVEEPGRTAAALALAGIAMAGAAAASRPAARPPAPVTPTTPAPLRLGGGGAMGRGTKMMLDDALALPCPPLLTGPSRDKAGAMFGSAPPVTPVTPVIGGASSSPPMLDFGIFAAAARRPSNKPPFGATAGKCVVANKRRATVVPFPVKLHDMLTELAEDKSGRKQSIVSWLPHGRALKVHKPQDFVKKILPKHFRQTKLTSFQRQLNVYGFTRLIHGPDRGAYYHRNFLRGRRPRAFHIARESIKGTGVRTTTLLFPEQEPNFYAMGPVEEEEERERGRKCKDKTSGGEERMAMEPEVVWSFAPPGDVPERRGTISPSRAPLPWPTFTHEDVFSPTNAPTTPSSSSSSGAAAAATMAGGWTGLVPPPPLAAAPAPEQVMSCCRRAARRISEDGSSDGKGGEDAKPEPEPMRCDLAEGEGMEEGEIPEEHEHVTGDRVQFEGKFFYYLHHFDASMVRSISRDELSHSHSQGSSVSEEEAREHPATAEDGAGVPEKLDVEARRVSQVNLAQEEGEEREEERSPEEDVDDEDTGEGGSRRPDAVASV